MISSLSRREIYILFSGIGFLVIFFGYQLIVKPVFEKQETLQRVLAVKQTAIRQMEDQQRQYRAAAGYIDSQTRDLLKRDKNFSLFSFLDNQARLSGVKENVAYMKPFSKKLEQAGFFSESVKLKLKAVYLKEIVDFINRIESSGNGVNIVSLSLTDAGKDKKQLDAVMETEILVMKGEGRNEI